MNEEISDTPRTDAACIPSPYAPWLVRADFARALERDGNKLHKKLTAAQRQIEELRSRLEIDPGGSDKIDELESSMGWLRQKNSQQAAEVERLRGALERLIKSINNRPFPFEVIVEIDIAQKALSAAPAGERVVSRDVLQMLFECAESCGVDAAYPEAFQAAETELARTAPRSGENCNLRP